MIVEATHNRCNSGSGTPLVAAPKTIIDPGDGNTTWRKSSDGVKLRQAKNDDEDEGASDNDPTAADEYLSEEEASRRLEMRLMLPRMVMSYASRTVTILAWGFVVISYVLNAMGYSFVSDDSGIRIDTLEAKQFLDEVAKSSKEI